MRRKLVGAFAVVYLGLTTLWVLTVQALPRPVEATWIAGIYERKEAAAARIEGAKVVIIGGSGTHYSYSARTISELTGFRVVNLGTHAGLGGEYILHRARASLKPGDTAVLALEQQVANRAPPSTVLSTFVTTSDPSYLLSAPLRHVPALLFGYPPAEGARSR